MKIFKSESVKISVIYFLVTRITLIFISVAVLQEFTLHSNIKSEHEIFHENSLLNNWGNFDTGWYLKIARDWYPDLKSTNSSPSFEQYSFFPLYPALIRSLHFVTGINNFILGLLISNVCFFLSGLLLYKISEKLYDKKIAEWSLIFMYLFPVSFIFSGVFTESLYLVVILSSFYFAFNEKWFAAGIFSLLLTLCRPVGFMIMLPLAFIYLKNKNFNFREINVQAMNFIFVPAGIILLLWLNYANSGDPFMFAHNPGYSGKISNPFINIFKELGSSYFTLCFLSWYTLVFILFWLFFYRHLKFAFHLVIIYSLFIPLSFGLMSMPRMILSAFPFFILVSSVACKYRLQNIFSIVLVFLQAFLFICWCFGFVTVV